MVNEEFWMNIINIEHISKIFGEKVILRMLRLVFSRGIRLVLWGLMVPASLQCCG